MDFAPIDSPTYKWIFVGGKGGVGKTTTSCSIAIKLTLLGRKVLLVSTDPASNIGDSFLQHFSSTPQLVNGFDKLYVMNLPTATESTSKFLQMMATLPGMDEVNALYALFNVIEHDDYDNVVFDTAPTGHTMKLLQLPTTVQKIFSDSIMSVMSSVFAGMGDSNQIERVTGLLQRASERLKNPMECTFICVLLPELLPLQETERLIQFLYEQEIESHTLVVNQVIPQECIANCPFCSKRFQAQQKHIHDIQELYEDFNVVHVPLFNDEIKGVEGIKFYSQYLNKLFS